MPLRGIDFFVGAKAPSYKDWEADGLAGTESFCVVGPAREVEVRRDGCRDAAPKPAPFKNRRVRHPEIQRRSFWWCGRAATRL
jgi:hypothetical protein